MPITADLTIRETAALSGVPRAAVEKAVEASILRTVAAPARLRGGATRYLPIRAVVYFHSLKAANLIDLPVRHKRTIWTHLAQLEPMRLETIEFSLGAMLDLERLAADSLRKGRAIPESSRPIYHVRCGHPGRHAGNCWNAVDGLFDSGTIAEWRYRR